MPCCLREIHMAAWLPPPPKVSLPLYVGQPFLNLPSSELVLYFAVILPSWEVDLHLCLRRFGRMGVQPPLLSSWNLLQPSPTTGLGSSFGPCRTTKPNCGLCWNLIQHFSSPESHPSCCVCYLKLYEGSVLLFLHVNFHGNYSLFFLP